MLKHLTKYIERYVLCKNCKYPEAVLYVEKNGKKEELKSKCNACGSTNSHDASHKAGKEIIKYLQKNKVGADIDNQPGEPTEPEPVAVSTKNEESDYEEEAKIDSKRIETAVDAIFDLKSVTYDSDT